MGEIVSCARIHVFHVRCAKNWGRPILKFQERMPISGAVRPAAQISVGTHEQLSILCRLSLAEYLATAIVLDEQLVQSDDRFLPA